MTFVLGLTGSIGMGKSASAAMFRARGVPVHDADAAVHALYRGEAAALIEAAFPGTVIDGVVERAKLGALVLGQPSELKRLEDIVHPLVRRAEQAFLAAAVRGGHPVAVLDVPLLLETGGEARCDAVLVVTASVEVQRTRVMARPGMTEAALAAILAKQMPDAEKRRRAHFVVDTGYGYPHAEAQICAILRALAGRPGGVRRRAGTSLDGGEG
jgi:dephospho-CoA kinase